MNKVLLTKQTVDPTLSLWDAIVSREGSSWTWVVRPFSLILMAASSSAPLLGTRVVNSSALPPMLPDTCLGRSSSPSTVNVRWMEGNLKCSVLCKTHLMFFLIALCISGLPFSSRWISNLCSICLVLLHSTRFAEGKRERAECFLEIYRAFRQFIFQASSLVSRMENKDLQNNDIGCT